MCGGAVNRQPGDRARNLQRRGYRAPPPLSKFFPDEKRNVFQKNWKNSTRQERSVITTFHLARELQSIWDFQETSLNHQRTWGLSLRRKRIVEILARIKTLPKFLPELRQSFFRRCPRLYITYRVVSSPLHVTSRAVSSPLQVMCVGAVNRQPGHRARNLQRGGLRLKPHWSRSFSSVI